nr:PilC/PilY family type IV pilus protein [Pseudoalteromonas espejiana]
MYRNIFTLLVFTFSSLATAEDIEIYVNKNVELDEKPRVLLIFDTSGSMDEKVSSPGTSQQCYIKRLKWSWRFGYYASYEQLGACYESKSRYREYNEQCYINSGSRNNPNYQPSCVDGGSTRLEVAKSAVKSLIESNEDIDFGLMRFNYNAGKEPGGGYVLAGIGANEGELINEIDKLPANGSTPLTETLWEAYLYITGQRLRFAKSINDRDKSIDKNNRYTSPFEQDQGSPLRCDNSINIILITDGEPQNDDEADDSIKNEHKDVFGSNGSSFGSYKSYLVALAKILYGTKTTSVDLYPETSETLDTGKLFTIGFGDGMGENALELLEEAAKVGGGDYFEAKSATALSSALTNTISQIRKENATFIAPSFSSNNVDQTRSGDAIYFSMFYPDKSTRWRGNLKKLKVSGNTIIDAKNNPALGDDGLIDTDAKTFWLPDGQSADGNSVAQGGVNYQLSSLTGSPAEDRRNLYTDKQGDIVELTTSTVSDILDLVSNNPISLASSDIKWAMGIDVDDEDNDGSNTDQRSDIFGDPLHSKPVAIDYGNGDIRILIGTNAGFLHMFKDDNNNNKVTESWAFIPSELYYIIKPLRSEDTGKLYGMDGPISVYSKNDSLNSDNVNDGIVDATKGDNVWAFAGMRRGGRNYYGFNITDPDDPKLKWTIQGGEGKFAKLGQTWSKPQVAFIRAFGDKPVLVFGGGYDENKDTGSGEDSVGNNVYIVDANNGNRLWSLLDDGNFNGKHSMAADVTLLDSDYDGYIDRIYAADTGGDIWRIDMPGDKTANFSHHKLAELGVGVDRRFFYKPLVARTMFSKVTIKGGETTRLDTPYDAIVIGSGKRTNPNDTKTSDQLFMIRDENTVTQSFKGTEPSVIKPADLMNMNDDPFGNALDNKASFIELEAKLGGKFKGWRYSLAAGEKSLAAANVVGGVAYFTSFTPASESSTKNQCSLSGGGGSLYAFHLHYGTKVYDDLKFATSTEVPDTPQLYFGEGPSCADGNGDGMCDDNPTIEVTQESQFYLIGPGIKGENAENPMKPVEIMGPGLTVVDGTVQLVNDDDTVGFGFKTQQTYIYKREENDENIQNEDD